MATWHDVQRVREQHPDYRPVQIAREIGCNEGWVRATFSRRGWVIPKRVPAYSIDAVAAGYRSGELLRDIAAANGIAPSHVIWLMRHHFPGEVGFRKRGPRQNRVAP